MGDTGFHDNHEHASWCEYGDKWSDHYSWKTHDSTMNVDVEWDCDEYTIHVDCHDEYNYKLGNGKWNNVKETSYTTSAPSGTSG